MNKIKATPLGRRPNLITEASEGNLRGETTYRSVRERAPPNPPSPRLLLLLALILFLPFLSLALHLQFCLRSLSCRPRARVRVLPVLPLTNLLNPSYPTPPLSILPLNSSIHLAFDRHPSSIFIPLNVDFTSLPHPSGGRPHPLPDGRSVSPNCSPHSRAFDNLSVPSPASRAIPKRISNTHLNEHNVYVHSSTYL